MRERAIIDSEGIMPTKNDVVHISFIDSTLKLCAGCNRQTHWRVRAGSSIYVTCVDCMGHSEVNCAMDISHRLCK